MKYGSLNLLEPSGPVQACNGIAKEKERKKKKKKKVFYSKEGLFIRVGNAIVGTTPAVQISYLDC